MADWFKYIDYSDNAPDGLNIAKTAYGAKYLIPKDNCGIADFNVHDDFAWTLSNKNTRKYIPRIELTEYKLKYSAELLSFINSARGFSEALDSAINTANPLLTLAGQAALATAAARGIQAGVSTGAGADLLASLLPGGLGTAARGLLVRGRAAGPAGLTEAAKKIGGIAGSAAGFVGAAAVGMQAYQTFNKPDELLFPGLDKARMNTNSALDPYTNLYRGVETKIKYTLPYISVDNMIETGSAWKEPGKEGPLNKLLDTSKNIFKKTGGGQFAIEGLDLLTSSIEAIALGGEPGTSREKIKGFTPSETGDSVSLTFYLFNTLNINDIQNNWEFLYTLTYQNLPNRRSINLLDPPCIYSVDIPGYKRFPVANIEKLKVSNEGTTRYVDLETGEVKSQAGGNNVKMIPEAYKVTLNIRSLLTPTQNLFQWSDDSNRVINVIGNPSKQDPLKPDVRQAVENLTAGSAFGGGTGGVLIPRGGYNAQNSSSLPLRP